VVRRAVARPLGSGSLLPRPIFLENFAVVFPLASVGHTAKTFRKRNFFLAKLFDSICPLGGEIGMLKGGFAEKVPILLLSTGDRTPHHSTHLPPGASFFSGSRKWRPLPQGKFAGGLRSSVKNQLMAFLGNLGTWPLATCLSSTCSSWPNGFDSVFQPKETT